MWWLSRQKNNNNSFACLRKHVTRFVNIFTIIIVYPIYLDQWIPVTCFLIYLTNLRLPNFQWKLIPSKITALTLILRPLLYTHWHIEIQLPIYSATYPLPVSFHCVASPHLLILITHHTTVIRRTSTFCFTFYFLLIMISSLIRLLIEKEI